MTSNRLLWAELSNQLRSVLNEHEFATWFSQTSFTMQDNIATLIVPNYLFLNWIKDHYQNILEHALLLAAGKSIPLNLTIADAHMPSAEPLLSALPAASSPPVLLGKEFFYDQVNPALNPLYLFSNFIVGPNNKLAHAACLAVAAMPGRQYNPLIIYGGSGLGKTHLLCAIGQVILQNNPSAQICYCSAEDFTNDLMKAVRLGAMAWFHKKYRQIDCLLLDDLQFLGEDKFTQEEFFHTFNSLYNSGQQIVVTSDRMPNHITSLDKIISNRFACGLSADIKPPGEELKIAILHHKASAKGMELETSLAQFLARQTDGNIRSLEGYLTKLSAISEIHDREINLELAAEIIEPITNNHKITLDDIIDLVAKHFAVSAEEIKSSKKNREITHPRQIAMYLSRKFTDHSFLEIGCSFGNKDHSTVLKGFKKIKTLIRNSDQGSEEIIRLENYITEGKYIKK